VNNVRAKRNRTITLSRVEEDLVLDPFMGTGSSVVTAKHLNRKFLGVEIQRQYCLLAAKRLHLAELDPAIQGYTDGVFWERITPAVQRREATRGRHG